MLESMQVFQAKSLLSCALKCLCKVVVNSCVSTFSIDNPSNLAVRNYLISIPSNILCDLWVKEIINVIKVHNLNKTDFIYTILFNSSLCNVDIDYINQSSLESNVSTLVKLFPLCINLKSLKSSHSPFFWNSSEIVLIENSFIHLRNLQEITLNNLNLKENVSFVSSIGTHCPKLKYLDISYSCLPYSSVKDIGHLSNLETLVIKTKTSEIPTLTKELAKLLLISLPKLRIFDDDWESVYSFIPVALDELIKNGSKNYACIEHLNIYKIEEAAHLSAHQHKSIKRLHLNSKIFRQKNVIENIDDWLKQFPSLQSINMRIENFEVLEKLLKNNTNFPAILHSLQISHCSLPINCEHVSRLGHLCPSLKSLEIVNPKYVHHPLPDSRFHQQNSSCFPELLNLSYSGNYSLLYFFLMRTQNLPH